MTLTKICGIKTPDALDAALDGGADLIGFNAFAKSPRFIAPADARPLREAARRRAQSVLLMVDPDDDAVLAAAAALDPDLIQLHGAESPQRCAQVKALTGKRVIKALGIGSAADVAEVADYAQVADILLLDHKPAPGAALSGGSGKTFDWDLLRGFPDPGVPWLLAGGLTPANVADALRRTGAPGVDVSSGVESAPGLKDPHLIRAFLDAVAKADKRD